MTRGSIRRTTRIWLLSFVILPLPAGCNTLFGGTAGGAGGGGGSSGTPSVSASKLEQLSLERINRARLRPVAEAAANGIALNEGVPAGSTISNDAKQAVAMNASLRQAAINHSQDMLTRDYFEHDSPDGTSPFDRMQNEGYLFTSAGENLAWRGTTGAVDEAQTVEGEHVDLFVDAGIVNRGHRTTMLTENFREVGIGIVRGTFTQGGTDYDSVMQTQDYGTPTSNSTFVLGVVYNDSNNNGQYDHGEGVANSSVELGGVTKTTNEGGGYSFDISSAGNYTLNFASGQNLSLTINTGDPNIKADLVDNSNIVVNLGLGILP